MKTLSANKNTYLRPILTGVFFGAVLAVAFVSGFYFRELIGIPMPIPVSAGSPDEAGYPLLDEAQYLLDSIYLREQPGYNERQYAAIRGVFTTLGDPNTFFIDPPVANSEA